MASQTRPKRERKPSKIFELQENVSVTKQKQPRKRAKKEPFAFTELPVNIRLKIVSFLNAGGLCSSATVSKDFKVLTENNSIWGIRLLERFGHLFDEEDGIESDEDIINNWPAKKPFKEIYRHLTELENQKQSHWASWGCPKEKEKGLVAGTEIAGKCPMCEGLLFIEKNVPKTEDDEDDAPPSELIVQCKTPKCHFVLPFSKCDQCKKPCNMMNTLICPGDKCMKKSFAERICCGDCSKECQVLEKDSKCLGILCNKCVKTVKTKKGAKNACTSCSFICGACSIDFFQDERRPCKKCKTVHCSHCASKGCKKCGNKFEREEEDEEFGAESEEEEDYEEDEVSD